jgi:hypothetical protein
LEEPSRRRPPIVRLSVPASSDDTFEARYLFLMNVQIGLGE